MAMHDFLVKHGRMPQTTGECLEVKHSAELMDMMDEAAIDPQFNDEETEWVEA